MATEPIPIIKAPVTVISEDDDNLEPTVSADISLPPTTTLEQDRESQGRRAADRLLAAVHPPKTTAEEDRVTASQRVVNLIWESTQKQIAQWVIGCALLVAVALAIFGHVLGSNEIQLAAVVFLFGVANLVTGFYFGRTNHQRTGGIGGGSVDQSR